MVDLGTDLPMWWIRRAGHRAGRGPRSSVVGSEDSGLIISSALAASFVFSLEKGKKKLQRLRFFCFFLSDGVSSVPVSRIVLERESAQETRNTDRPACCVLLGGRSKWRSCDEKRGPMPHSLPPLLGRSMVNQLTSPVDTGFLDRPSSRKTASMTEWGGSLQRPWTEPSETPVERATGHQKA